MEMTAIIIMRIEASELPEPAQREDSHGTGRIIVPLDGSELALAALEPAMKLAVRLEARLELLTTRVPDWPIGLVGPSEYLDQVANDLEGYMTSTVTRPERDPAEAINAVVAEGDEPTLIMMSSHGRTRFGRAVLGSVAERVVAEAHVPVLVVGPHYRNDQFDLDGPLLIAHDGEHQPPIDDVCRIAAATGGEVAVLQVVGSSEVLPLEGCSSGVEDFVATLRSMGHDVTCEAHLGDHPHEVILEHEDFMLASIVGVTTRANTGFPRIAHGSVAAELIRASEIPVLLMATHPDPPGSD